MSTSKIKDIMTSHPTMVAPGEMVSEAAKRMKAVKCGCLPVGSDGDVVGMITDRDITLRVVADGLEPKQTRVSDVMTKGVFTIDEDQDVDAAAQEMQSHQVARLIVTHRKKITGILTMAELLRDAAATAHSPKVLRELAKMNANHHTAH